jgi:hypothetical protein
MKFVFSAFLIFNLVNFAAAQSSAALKLTLAVKAERLCVGEPFGIQARIDNASNKNQVIDVRSVWRYISAASPKTDSLYGEDRSFAQNLDESLKKPRFLVVTGENTADKSVPVKYLVTLRPGGFYEDEMRLDKDSFDNFFRTPGEYTFESAYSQYDIWTAQGYSMFNGYVESNRIKFSLSDCK